MTTKIFTFKVLSQLFRDFLAAKRHSPQTRMGEQFKRCRRQHFPRSHLFKFAPLIRNHEAKIFLPPNLEDNGTLLCGELNHLQTIVLVSFGVTRPLFCVLNPQSDHRKREKKKTISPPQSPMRPSGATDATNFSMARGASCVEPCKCIDNSSPS